MKEAEHFDGSPEHGTESQPKLLKEPSQMSYEEFLDEYLSVMNSVAVKEKQGGLDPDDPTSYRGITPEEAGTLEQDWREFSRQRGFTKDDIEEYDRWLTLSGQRDNFDGAINDPWRRRSNEQAWASRLYKQHTGQPLDQQPEPPATAPASEEDDILFESKGDGPIVW